MATAAIHSATSASVAGNETLSLTEPFPLPAEIQNLNLIQQTPADAHAKSWGCLECHKDSHDPHMKGSLSIGCTDCHGGSAATTVKDLAHVHPRYVAHAVTFNGPSRVRKNRRNCKMMRSTCGS